MPNLELKIPPPVVGALIAAAMWGIATVGAVFAIAQGPKVSVLAILVATGVAFDLLGVWTFRTSRTTISPLKPQRASTLLTDGVFRVTRNPMYLGMACLLLAWAVHLSALLPLVGVVVFVAYITRFQIWPEERALAALFGEQYSRYVASVRRGL